MSDSLFDETGHLTAEALGALRDGTLDGEDLEAAAEHMAQCELCAGAFAALLETGGLAEVPAGFSQEVLGKIDTKKGNGILLVFFSLRVAAAVCAALFILFSGLFDTIDQSSAVTGGIKAPGFSLVDKISSNLRDFSQNVINMEVFHHAKE